MKIIARAIYQDKLDAATFEFRIETRPDGYALIHGLAGRQELQTEEFFDSQAVLDSMLPTPYPETPQMNFAVESLLSQWASAMTLTQYDVDEAHRGRQQGEQGRKTN